LSEKMSRHNTVTVGGKERAQERKIRKKESGRARERDGKSEGEGEGENGRDYETV